MRLSELTKQEQAVIRLYAEGYLGPSVAAHLGVTHRTVKFHISNIRSRLGMVGGSGSLVQMLRYFYDLRERE
jgi:DNA-binding NarL/FixJ family response regulator